MLVRLTSLEPSLLSAQFRCAQFLDDFQRRAILLLGPEHVVAWGSLKGHCVPASAAFWKLLTKLQA